MRHQLHVPYVVEQDDDGIWTAEAALTPDSFLHANGRTREAALEDLREAILEAVNDAGLPEQLVVDVEIP
ncbi:type II toxin-antitoxin system HicB family antitoxin [Kribbella sp. NPDC004875]|uniref:type II toxin-antitoxin system HicB family antitoxin n=1 Tax=Kribbella sp. NPDC004875 TaxID=3364107 RepID=UPI00369974CB